MNPRISTHYCLDDPRQWRFERASGLPYRYFKRPPLITADRCVCVALVLAGIALWLIP